MTGVRLEAVSVAYDGREVVSGVSARIETGRWVALLGPNGAGKSSLIKAIAGLVPSGGVIRIDGRPVAEFRARHLARTVAYVPQRPLIPPPMLVSDYVLLGRTPYIPYFGTERATDVDVANDVIRRLELAPLADRAMGTLSGGEVQRAVLARALAQQAPVLLLDEPTAALDIGYQQEVLELVDALRRERELTLITSLHDLTLAGQFAEELLVIDKGRVVADGAAREVLTEALVHRHFGAKVRIVHDDRGGVAIVPVRNA